MPEQPVGKTWWILELKGSSEELHKFFTEVLT